MIKNITTSALLFIIGISVGIFFSSNDNNTLESIKTTKSIDNIDEDSRLSSIVVNHISIQDLKSSLRDIMSELLLKYEENKISFNEQQPTIDNKKPVLNTIQLQQQQNDIELARSYIINAISDGTWSNSDVTSFNALSSKIPTSELTKILSPFYIAINKGLITPAKGVMLF